MMRLYDIAQPRVVSLGDIPDSTYALKQNLSVESS